MNVEICGQYRALFGEGPIWHDRYGLLWLDTEEQKIISYNEKTNIEKIYDAKGWIKSIIPTIEGDLIAIYKDGLYSYNLENETRTFLCAPPGLNNMHYLNDAKCDFHGFIWVGSSDGGFKEFKENEETASLPYPKKNSFLFRIDQQLNTHIAKDQITISNGLDWNRQNEMFYYIDSAKQAIFEYEIDNKKELQNERLIYQLDVMEGFPDGMTIDVNGNLWVAIFKSGVIARNSNNTSKILHINPQTKSILNEITIPVPHVTSCTIGGNQLDTLFITTALEPIQKDKRKEVPYAGYLHRTKIPTKGVKPYYFTRKRV